MEHESVVHLVLRLRGGDGGGSMGPSRYSLAINVDGRMISVREPEITAQSPISELYKKVLAEFPLFKNFKFTLTYSNKTLEEEKLISDYSIPSGSKINIEGVPAYLLNVDKLIKLMKVNGSWKYDEAIITGLNLKQTFEDKLAKYSTDKDKAMTDTVVTYLRKNYPQRN